jgi:tetratricopeptide (TPR) repeat protein
VADVLPLGRVGGAAPIPPQARSRFNPFSIALLTSWSPDEPSARLAPLPGLSVVEQLLRRSVASGRRPDRPLLLSIDQFEDAARWSLETYRDRDGFLSQLTEALLVLPELHILLAVRDAAVADVGAWIAARSDGGATKMKLEPLSPGAAIAAVRELMRLAGRTLPAGIAEGLVSELLTARVAGDDGGPVKVSAASVEPAQLQAVCALLRESFSHGAATIGPEQVEGIVDVALAGFRDRAVRAVSQRLGVPAGELVEWLARTFLTVGGMRAGIHESTTRLDLLRAFEDLYLVRTEHWSDVPRYEIASDRLAVTIAASRTPAPVTERSAPPEPGRPSAQAGSQPRLTPRERTRSLAEQESLLGDAAVEEGEFAEAEAHYRGAAQMFTRVDDAHAVGRLLAAIGELQLQAGHTAAAVTELQGAVIRLRGEVEPRLALARALWRSGQLRAAAALYGSVLTVAPGSAAALGERGELRVELGEFDGALEDLHNLARVWPDAAAQPEARSARALALAGAGRLVEASAEAAAASSTRAPGGPVLARAAAVAARAGDYEEADALLRRAAGADPAPRPRQVMEVRRLLHELTARDRPSGP